MRLSRFFPYYGSKARLASKYPSPTFNRIVEPFGGSAGYSLRYSDRNVVINELDPILFGVWSYLTKVKPSEIKSLSTTINDVDELGNVPEEAKWLVGFWLHVGSRPSKKRTGWNYRPEGRSFSSWADDARQRIADQVEHIRHWKIVSGSFEDLPNNQATWFVDPPYQNECGRHYSCNQVDFPKLGSWCKTRTGQVIACEQLGADWLPFETLCTISGLTKKPTTEVVWNSRS